MNTKTNTVDVPPRMMIRSQGMQVMSAFFRHRLAQAGLMGLAVIAILAITGPLLLSDTLNAMNVTQIHSPPSVEHLLGTDHLGRDLLIRLFEGGRVSLLVALVATTLATFIGCIYGIISGIAREWIDRVMMQALDAVLAIPVILLVVVSQAFGQSSLLKVTLVIGLASWMGTARMMRTECRKLMGTDFIKAAIATGTSPLSLVFRHLLPNTFAPLVVVITIGISQAILLESTLSFLNLGVPSTLPSWGNLLGNGMSSVLSGAWWMVLFPGLMIVITALSINMVGDGLRDAVDPKQRNLQ